MVAFCMHRLRRARHAADDLKRAPYPLGVKKMSPEMNDNLTQGSIWPKQIVRIQSTLTPRHVALAAIG